MLSAGCTCLYALMHGHWQHFHSVPFQRYEIHISVLTAAMQGWFWIWISSVNHIIAGDSGLLWVCMLLGIVPGRTPPWTVSGQAVFCQMPEACSKTKATCKNTRPSKTCLSLAVALHYQTGHLEAGYCSQFLITTCISLRSRWSMCLLLQKLETPWDIQQISPCF